jgi:alcohol dehydrogenase (cytochrome c)
MKKILMTVTAAAVVAAVAVPAAARDVTAQRLDGARDEPQNWLMIHGDYLNHRWSRLNQINVGNVHELRPVFSVAIGGWASVSQSYDPPAVGSYGIPDEEGTPLVDDGFLYIADGLYKINKIDVRSGTKGEIVWRFDPEVSRHRTNRGVAMINNSVYIATGDMRMLRVDRDSGEAVYDVNIQAPTNATYGTPSPVSQTVSAAPMTYRSASGRELVFQGESSGGSRGTISWCSAWDAETGEMAWRWYSVPFPGEFGHDTWKNENWRTGGGGCWAPPAYDKETNTIFAGTGDTWPSYDPEFRPGDNLFTASTVALNADTGELEWWFQATPNERWDLDEAAPRLVFKSDAFGGNTIVANFERQGYYYLWDHTDTMARGSSGPVRATFLQARPYQDPDNINWTAGIDPKTGFPVEYDPNLDVQKYIFSQDMGLPRSRLGETALYCPTWYPAPTALMPPAFNSNSRLHYGVASEQCRMGNALTEPMDPNKDFVGERGCCWEGTNIPGGGIIVAMNVDTGERVKKVRTPLANESGLLGTDGGLLFTGHNNGKVTAYDADSLAEVWSYNAGVSIKSPAITYAVDGRQYIAIVAGGGDNRFKSWGVLNGATLYVFGLGR